MPNKPTGQIGPNVISVSARGTSVAWSVIRFPHSKQEIERQIVDRFKTAGTKAGFTIFDVQQNAEDDLDFTMKLPGGKVLLELTELTYADAGNAGPPYASRGVWIDGSRYAEQILERIANKSAKYGRNASTPTHLLTYITHWRFLPSDTVIRTVQSRLRDVTPTFENIFLLLPIDAAESVLRCLFPVPDSQLTGFDPEQASVHEYVNFDPGNWQVG
jgi:hypothetical protein